MTPNIGVTDDQLGRFYRKMKAITERLGKSLSFDEVMQALQLIHDGKMRTAGDTSEDLGRLFQRTIGQKKTLEFLVATGVPDVAEKESTDLFCNRRRFDIDNHVRAYTLSGKQFGQEAGAVSVYKITGMHSSQTMAAEFLNVSDETPAFWIMELLISRGHTFTVPAIEKIIEMQMGGVDVGLNRCKKAGDLRDYPGNLAFIETFPGKVELMHFSRKSQVGWRIWREPFDVGGQSRRDQDYLVIRN